VLLLSLVTLALVALVLEVVRLSLMRRARQLRTAMAEVFQTADGKHKSLLMAEPVEAGVLEILNVDGGHLVHRRVPLLPQAWKIFLKPEKGEPLFETSRHVLWQAVVDVQLGDLHLEPLPVRWVLDPDGSEVFRGHPGDGGHVVAGCSEQVEVLLVVEIGEPGGENLLVRDAGLEHLLDVQGLDVVCVQAWLERSSSC